MDKYTKEQIETYWLKQGGKKCPKCKIGKLRILDFLMCVNCGESPVGWYIFKNKA